MLRLRRPGNRPRATSHRSVSMARNQKPNQMFLLCFRLRVRLRSISTGRVGQAVPEVVVEYRKSNLFSEQLNFRLIRKRTNRLQIYSPENRKLFLIHLALLGHSKFVLFFQFIYVLEHCYMLYSIKGHSWYIVVVVPYFSHSFISTVA